MFHECKFCGSKVNSPPCSIRLNWGLLFFVQEQANEFGVDWEEPNSESSSCTTKVDVPDTNCPIPELYYVRLKASINPLSESLHYGIDLYNESLNFVMSCGNVSN